MSTYKEMYLKLSSQVTNALDELERLSPSTALEILKQAQTEADKMYRAMYLKLSNRVTDAIIALECSSPYTALEILRDAQEEAEEMYIESEE